MGQPRLKKSRVAIYAMPLVIFPPFMEVDLLGSWPLSPPANSSPINLTSVSHSQLPSEKTNKSMSKHSFREKKLISASKFIYEKDLSRLNDGSMDQVKRSIFMELDFQKYFDK